MKEMIHEHSAESLWHRTYLADNRYSRALSTMILTLGIKFYVVHKKSNLLSASGSLSATVFPSPSQ
jgi:hypothetical protein